MKAPFIWDPYSDQPYPIKERAYKKAMRKKAWVSLLKTLVTALVMLPVSLVTMPFIRPKNVDNRTFFGLGVSLDKAPSESVKLVEELGVDALLIRFKLWEMERLNEYLTFVRSFEGKTILLNVMQDREHIEDISLLEKDLQAVFTAFSPYVQMFQIGTTINRAKWGFFSIDEYLKFFQTAQKLKKSSFPNITLLGSGVIDFEFHFTAHTLFNCFKVHYDGVAALLYVDRRGAPENGQMGFALLDKIALLASMVRLSPKTANRLYLTETNWPISGTAPYAPTSELECVDEESYANFMVRYYLLAFASRQVNALYWHQLIAPGYGLIDNRDTLRKRTAFLAFKTMLAQLKGAGFLRLIVQKEHYTLFCQSERGLLQVIWSRHDEILEFETDTLCITRDGQEAYQKSCTIGVSPLYIYPEVTAT